MYRKIVICAVAILLPTLTGCPGGGDEQGGPPNPTVSTSPIVGSWSYTDTGASEEEGAAEFNALISFNANGSFDVYLMAGSNSTIYLNKCSSTYDISGDKVTIHKKDCEDSRINETTAVFTVSGDTLTLTSEGETITFSRWTGNVSQLHPAAGTQDTMRSLMKPQRSLNLQLFNFGEVRQ